MKDYSINDFQRKSFILSYEKDIETNEIIIHYADNTTRRVINDTIEEMKILKQMRRQVLDGKKSYLRNSKILKEGKFLKLISKIAIASIAAIMVQIIIRNGFIASFPAVIWDSFLIGYNFYSLRKVSKVLKKVMAKTEDYEKSLYYVEHADNFENSRIMKNNILHQAPLSVNKIIATGLADNLNLQGAQAEDNKPLDVDVSIVGLEDKVEGQKASVADAEKQLIANGFTNLSEREVPFINENTIAYLSKQALEKMNDLSVSSNSQAKGRVYSKVFRAYKS